MPLLLMERARLNCSIKPEVYNRKKSRSDYHQNYSFNSLYPLLLFICTIDEQQLLKVDLSIKLIVLRNDQMMKHFKTYSRATGFRLTKTRRFVTRVGEAVHLPIKMISHLRLKSSLSAQFVLFGIPEDIGIRANMG